MTRAIIWGSSLVVLAVGCEDKTREESSAAKPTASVAAEASGDELERELEEARSRVNDLGTRVTATERDEKKRQELQDQLDAAIKAEEEAAKAAGKPVRPRSSAPCTCKKDDPLCDCH